MPSKKTADQLVRVTIESPADLRRWLKGHHQQRESVWIVTWRKGSPKYVPWDDLIDEALCFGWIDSVPRKLDGDRTMRLLSPRKRTSAWSRVNKEKVKRLINGGRMMAPGLAAVERAKADGRWEALDEVENLSVPDDLSSVLRAYPDAEQHFNRFRPSSRRAILEWISGAKSPETRRKRVEDTAAKAAQNIKANHPKDREAGPSGR